MSSLPLHPYDILMLVILVVVTLHGAWKGVAWQVASLTSIGLSIYVAARFNAAIAPWFGKQDWNRFAAMLVLFLLTSLAVWLLFRFVSEFINKLKLQQFDHQLGAVFGLAKAILYCLVITFFAVTMSETSRQAVLHARASRYATRIIRYAKPLLPVEAHELLDTYISKFERELNPRTPPAGNADNSLRQTVTGTAERFVPQGQNGGGAPPGGHRP